MKCLFIVCYLLEHSCFTNSDFKPLVSCKSKLWKIGRNLTFQKLLYKAVIPIKQHWCVHVCVCMHRHGTECGLTDNYWRRKNGEKLGKNTRHYCCKAPGVAKLQHPILVLQKVLGCQFNYNILTLTHFTIIYVGNNSKCQSAEFMGFSSNSC